MRMVQFGFICLLLALLFGCSSEAIQNKPIFQKTVAVKVLLNQAEWDEAYQEAKSIQKLYAANKWKYQLLSDETEYNHLDESIAKLIIALEEKDKTEAKLNIAIIEKNIESLYFR